MPAARRNPRRLQTRPARFTLADIAWATRAAKEQGAAAVEVLPDGTIRVLISINQNETKPEAAPLKLPDFKL